MIQNKHIYMELHRSFQYSNLNVFTSEGQDCLYFHETFDNEFLVNSVSNIVYGIVTLLSEK